MKLASRNQLANVANVHQGPTKRVLCVCSAGLLRSPTLANVLHQEYRFNTRACGATEEYALIPISEALVAWADMIVFVEPIVYDYALLVHKIDVDALERAGKTVRVLNIPDQYEWNHEELRQICISQFDKESTPS